MKSYVISSQKEEYFSTAIINIWWRDSWTAKNMGATYREWEGDQLSE
jgi:hypothetical protein